jgi:DNA-binding response OmpR family regulator
VGRRILVVEDSEEVREFLVLLFESEGFSVEACEDADQALARVRRERPDLVMTDLMLGATSGLELITRLRSDLAPPVPPIVACSGFNGFEKDALERGADAFIPKPADATTILSTVSAVLARRQVDLHQREEAAARARSRRATAVEAARRAAVRLEHVDNLIKRAQATADFLPRYFGFGQAFAALFEDDALRVRTSSSPTWSPGRVLDISLCRDIMETSSALLIPDLRSLGVVEHDPEGKQLRFFAGVPLLSGSIGVGTICFLDRAPHPFFAEDYSVLEAFGRRASAVMSGQSSEIPPMWTSSGLMSREGLGVVLASELSRTETRASSLSLLVLAGRAPGVPERPRTAVAELAPDRFAILCERPPRNFMEKFVHDGEFAGGGLVEIEGRAGSLFDARSILYAAERLLESTLQTAPGTVERIVFRREPHALDAIARQHGLE